MREMKFRAWDGKEMKTAFDLTQDPKYWWEGNRDYPLMQYTGSKDMHGEEIYEGDVWEYNEYTRHVIKFDIERVGWYPFADGDGCGCCSFDVYSPDHGKVIGNIYRNPELLGESS